MSLEDEIRAAQQALDAGRRQEADAASAKADRLRSAQSELASIGREAVDECRRRSIPTAAAVGITLKNSLLRGEVYDFPLKLRGWRLGALFLSEQGVFFECADVKPDPLFREMHQGTFEKGRARALRALNVSRLCFANSEYLASGSEYWSTPTDSNSGELVIDPLGTLYFQYSGVTFRSVVARALRNRKVDERTYGSSLPPDLQHVEVSPRRYRG